MDKNNYDMCNYERDLSNLRETVANLCPNEKATSQMMLETKPFQPDNKQCRDNECKKIHNHSSNMLHALAYLKCTFFSRFLTLISNYETIPKIKKSHPTQFRSALMGYIKPELESWLGNEVLEGIITIISYRDAKILSVYQYAKEMYPYDFSSQVYIIIKVLMYCEYPNLRLTNQEINKFF